ncbi:MAG TPA: molybdopterin-dependent oxidoreductase [Candidatus Binataceae bacterium]|nr:molybdopterin-dependent oxidoreductase [Candidatus Binataceae bacterium]
MIRKLTAFAFRPPVLLGLLVLLGPSTALAQVCSPAGGYSSSFVVTGDVQEARTFTQSSLEALTPVSTVDDFFISHGGTSSAQYTGIGLWDLLNAVGLKKGINLPNEYIVVTGSDCYQMTFSMGEIDPYIGGTQDVIIAYELAGAPLDASSGFAKLSIPGDKMGARRVSWIVEIQVLPGTSS